MKTLKTEFVRIIVILIAACKKKPAHSPFTSMGANGLNGEKTEYASGKGNITKFTDTEYEIIQAGKTISKGTYTIMAYKAMKT